MRFWHRYNTEPVNDGGFVEISVNEGIFTPVPKEKFIRNGYNGQLSYSTLATPNLYAFSGNSGGDWKNIFQNGEWIESFIDISEYKDQTVKFRFRFGSNPTVKASDYAGWFIDDFGILDIYKYTAQACIVADGGMGTKACTDSLVTYVNSGTVGSKDENESFFNIKLMPNPAKEQVTVAVNAPFQTTAMINILTLEGKILYSAEMSVNKDLSFNNINIQNLPKGFYVVKIQNGAKITSRKLVVN